VTQKGNIILDMQYMQNLLCLVALVDSVESDDLTVSDQMISPSLISMISCRGQQSWDIPHSSAERVRLTHLTQTIAIFQCYRRWKTNAHTVPFTGTKLSGQIPKDALREVKEISLTACK